ncbi:MAG: prepilin-type N-terminal cleavage/methylation domain-containing protein [Desulfuromonadales bacterium]|nr:prepilin-type N-terminal cleavage/methylation domain-containing protein [Desulfuromonadales bacterium]
MKTRWMKKMGEKGFTLMELLIVIVILGFLIGMIAPRLSSIIDDTVIDNICDSNNKGMRQYTNMFLQKKSRLPNNMINLVNDVSGTYTLPVKSNGDPTDGAETFAADFFERNLPTIYTLNTAEAKEIKDNFGISVVRYLNDAVGSSGVTGQPYAKADVEDGLEVAMVGDITTAATTWTGTAVYPVGNPFWAGRIILGLGKHSELVTEGYIAAAALCPGGIQNADNVVFNSYCLILPRLQGTVDKAGFAADGAVVTFRDADAPATSAERTSFTYAAQEAWEFEFTCPEGHKWPDNDNDNWVYSTN